MKHITLPNTDLAVSLACLGTMTFGSQVGLNDAHSMVDFCDDAGINFFDTANAYNQGRSEEILGETLKTRRDRVVLASKVFNKMGDGPEDRGLSAKAISKAIDDSLKRLQTDYLDIYYLHAPDYSIELEETLRAMDQLVKQGKIRYIGSSNYASWQLCRLFWLADREGLATLPIAQPMYNLIARGIEQEYLPACKLLGVSNIVYNPLAGGLLSGKHTRKSPIPGSRFDANKLYTDRFWHDANFDAVDQLQSVADADGRSLVSLAMNWLLHHTTTDSIILGASSMQQLEQNVASLGDGPLTDESVVKCDDVWSSLRGVTPQYNR